MTHPITPPPDLVEQWEGETAHTTKDEMWHVAVQAAQLEGTSAGDFGYRWWSRLSHSNDGP